MGGLSSPPASFNYEALLLPPFLFQQGISPTRLPSQGGVVTLTGTNFGGNAEVLFTAGNASEVTLAAIDCVDDSLQVCVLRLPGAALFT